jgi:RNA polymerase sigma-70 factor (ECF subfamily)
MTSDDDLYEIVFRFKPMAANAARGLNCEAEDILHDVYIKLLHFTRNKSLWPDPTGLVWKMVRDRISDLYRERERENRRNTLYNQEVVMPLQDKLALPVDEVVARHSFFFDWDQETRQAWLEVSDEYSGMILLRDIFELSYIEISEYLDIPIGTVKSRIHRGRRAFAKALDKIRGEEVN